MPLKFFSALLALLALLSFAEGLEELGRKEKTSQNSHPYNTKSPNRLASISNAEKWKEPLKSSDVAGRIRRDTNTAYYETEPLEGAASRDQREGVETLEIDILEKDNDPGLEASNSNGEGYVAPSDEAIMEEDDEQQDFNSRTKRLTPAQQKDQAPLLTGHVPWMQEPNSEGQNFKAGQSNDGGPHQVVEIGTPFKKFVIKVPVTHDNQAGYQNRGPQKGAQDRGHQRVVQVTPRPQQGQTHKIQVLVRPQRPQQQAPNVVYGPGGRDRNPQPRPIRPRPVPSGPQNPPRRPQPRPPSPPVQVLQKPRGPLQGSQNPRLYIPKQPPQLQEGGSEVDVIVDEVHHEGSSGPDEPDETLETDEVPLVPEPPGGPSTSLVADYNTYPAYPDPQVYDYALPQPQQPQQPPEYPQYPSYDYREAPPGPPAPHSYPDYQQPPQANYHPKPSGSKLACNADYDWGCYSSTNIVSINIFLIPALVFVTLIPVLIT